MKKLGDVVYNLLNLAVLGFWFYGACLYPENPLSVVIFWVTALVVGYIIFSGVMKINDYFLNKKIDRIYNVGKVSSYRR